jgi:hypothetical protein
MITDTGQHTVLLVLLVVLAAHVQIGVGVICFLVTTSAFAVAHTFNENKLLAAACQ